MSSWPRILIRARLHQARRQVYHDQSSLRTFSVGTVTHFRENTAEKPLRSEISENNTGSKWINTFSDSSSVRTAMRQLPYPIVLLTTSSGHIDHPLQDFGKNDLHKNYGVILSTFNTVTMGPPAMISFNLRLPSHTWDMLQTRKLFFVNFLAASPIGAKVADAFIRKSHDDAYKFCQDEIPGANLSWEPFIQDKSSRSLSNNGLDKTAAAFAVAGEAGLRCLSCALVPEKCVSVDDHMICVAEVLATTQLSSAENQGVQTGLLYWGGDFGSARMGSRFAEPEEEEDGLNVLDSGTR